MEKEQERESERERNEGMKGIDGERWGGGNYGVGQFFADTSGCPAESWNKASNRVSKVSS